MRAEVRVDLVAVWSWVAGVLCVPVAWAALALFWLILAPVLALVGLVIAGRAARGRLIPRKGPPIERLEEVSGHG